MPISANVAGPFLGGPLYAPGPLGGSVGGPVGSGRLSRLERPSRRGGPNDDGGWDGRGPLAEPEPGSAKLYRGALANGLGDCD